VPINISSGYILYVLDTYFATRILLSGHYAIVRYILYVLDTYFATRILLSGHYAIVRYICYAMTY
jgi:hypothetical protein